MKEYEAVKTKLRSQLAEKRYLHSIGVSETAALLAKRFGANEQKAVWAGLLHDCARTLPAERLLLTAEKWEITVDPIERCTPILLHAKLGALMAVREYGVNDAEICRAIASHTTGRSGMTLLDKIIYLADFIEPARSFPGVEELRILAKENLDKALLAAYNQSVIHILHHGGLLHPDTIDGRNELIMQNWQAHKNGGIADE